MTNLAEVYPENLIVIREVGMRDGLQLAKGFPSTAGKVEWLKKEFDAGIRHFEAGSYLPPARYPQLPMCRLSSMPLDRWKERTASRWRSIDAARRTPL